MTIVGKTEQETEILSVHKKIIDLIKNNVIDFEYVEKGQVFFTIHDYEEEVDLIFPITVSELENRRINDSDTAGAFFTFILKAHKEGKLVKKED